MFIAFYRRCASFPQLLDAEAAELTVVLDDVEGLLAMMTAKAQVCVNMHARVY